MSATTSEKDPWPVRTVARKIAATVKALGLQRFQLKISAGPLTQDKLLRCIGLYGRQVIPMVRELLAA